VRRNWGEIHSLQSSAVILLTVLLLHIPSLALSWQIETAAPRAVSAILIEPITGQVFYEMNADAPRAPASIAKLMLELLVLERVQAGELKLDDPITVSGWSSRIGGSQVYLKEGEVFPLEELMKAIVIHSANDACAAVAEHIAGTTEGFVEMTNQRARELGLTHTRFVNVHGLDDEPGVGNVTTAREIATIASRLIAMPHVLDWSSTVQTTFRDGQFTLQNTNKLLGKFPGMDGLKTGYTKKAGFCLCATAQRKGLRLVSVVMGAESNKARFDETARLLSAGFAQLSMTPLFATGDPIPGGVPLTGGRKNRIDAIAAAPLQVIISRRMTAPKPVFVPRQGLRAPIAKGDTVGTVEVRFEDGNVLQAPAVSAVAIKRATVFQRIGRMFGGGRS
jgi:serine-type D-Ala-D-Ala carboxypeptidase (penicillin-binding protein 5/6)